MYTVGIGSKDALNNANVVYKGFENLKIKFKFLKYKKENKNNK